ncbi:class I SAM-dependent methyltransferase [Fulvivirga lutea]|uniref:Class I SAM-dependent methyltransferase n=1 Tax=Fulvivirga lutea TaxID=2810512 RepID=A0A975A1N5_9BACT|nr:class I SAM-dependent methyltransferase [Fulvivirga lutea]QSE98410.1 class I SAM-dependent methyltransferase [Fulvivirga lutea]
MNNKIKVFEQYESIPYITRQKANIIYDLIRENKPDLCLELGFYHGKSSAVIAQALEDNGNGKLITLDLPSAFKRTPNVNDVLLSLNLSHRVDVITDEEGFHWSLMDILERDKKPKFDFAYIDGAHTWEGTGFAVFLLERMLNPGAYLVFDDLNWTIEQSNKNRERNGKKMINTKSTLRQSQTPGVLKVFNIICSEPYYTNHQRILDYGICQRSNFSLMH